MSVPERRKLPARRRHLTEKVALLPGTPEGRSFHMSFGVDEATGRVGDIWIDGPKAGSHEQAALHDAAAIVSVALQHGIPAAALAAATDRPDGVAQSVLAAALTHAAAIDAAIDRKGDSLSDNRQHGLPPVPEPAWQIRWKTPVEVEYSVEEVEDDGFIVCHPQIGVGK